MIQLNTPQPARQPDSTVKAQTLAYLIFDKPDLDAAESFLTDFGLKVVSRTSTSLYLRGTDTSPFCYVVRKSDQSRFVGFGLTVSSYGDLQKLCKLPNASQIHPSDMPGGGTVVTLSDPSGFRVDAVFERLTVTALEHRPLLEWNLSGDAKRINKGQRPPVAPAEVMRLGHIVLEVVDFQSTCGWYTKHFGFIPSDVQLLENGQPIVTFMRLNLGNQPTDHHTLAIAQGIVPTYSHSAFEMLDTDAVGMGQRVLRERGWKHAWGMGRHILGSQIFDYWQDPWGDKHEHYCDGDLCTENLQTGMHLVSREAMSQWGPVMPASFTKPTLTLKNIVQLIKNLRNSPDLTFKKLVTIARLFG
jgi:catechol 2,3-dioxygenase-like lactoylglutathione lyase family enzyme